MLIDREMSKDRKFKYICRRFGVVIKISTINYLFPHSKKSNLGGRIFRIRKENYCIIQYRTFMASSFSIYFPRVKHRISIVTMVAVNQKYYFQTNGP